MKNLNNYLFNYKSKTILWLFITIVTSILNTGASLLLMYLMDSMIEGDLSKSIIIFILNIVMWIFYFILDFFKTKNKNKLITNINSDLRNNYISDLQNKSYKDFHSNDIGNYISWLTNDINQIENLGLQSIFSMYENIILAIASLISLGIINIWLSVTSIILFLIIYYLPKIFDSYIQSKANIFSNNQSIYTKSIKNILNGFDIWKDYQALDKMKCDSNQLSNNLENNRYKYYNSQAIITDIIGLLNIIVQSLNNLLCIYFSIIGLVSPGALLSVGNLSGRLYNSLADISEFRVKASSCKNLLPKDNYNTSSDHTNYISFNNAIIINNLTYSYDDKPLIQNISLIFKKNKKYALIGKSGCGKSTILKIISNKITDYSGNVEFDNINLKTADNNSILEKIAYIDQDSYLFDTTILDNLTLQKSYSKEAIMKAVKDSCLNDFIKTYDDLKQPISENGNNLSGGQKQRIALARAILSNKEIYLIDEVTSGLDRTNMLSIENYLLSNPDITLIYVSHHLTDDIKDKFDQIYNLSNL